MKAKDIEKVLVTGGAGFIGSHTTDLLMEHGYQVTILDNLEPQVHGQERKPPEYINKNAVLIYGNVLDRELLTKTIREVDAIIHLAAMVGVGQSMYQIERYVDANTRGTSNILDVLINTENNIKKLVVASSMSIYGEGKYHCKKCSSNVYPGLRNEAQLGKKQWDHFCPTCGYPLTSLPTDEEKPLLSTSIYAMTKRHQEEMCLLIGKAYSIPTVALRYFNIYGSRQALSNPYTGCAAIFTSRILNDKPPYIFEDGNQTRDFIHVKDVAQANLSALEHNNADYQTINIGTGKSLSIKNLAETLTKLYDKPNLQPSISNEYRKGDIRHCYADISKAQKLLDFKPNVTLEDGLTELAEWAKTHGWNVTDLFEKALKELKEKHLAT
ncbi:nucleoside-diphosphate sugar epimerase [Candidatus Bathyarchaeota archaeon RBG_13_38_9]|nr:MAG: nucleoside-diphosphate sugar epimerase [Candidatus Bathyarchaeota archaeon RBG_13_38_9]